MNHNKWKLGLQAGGVGCLGVICLNVLIMGCSGSNDSWYSRSRQLDHEKDEYIQRLEDQGVDPDTARSAWNTEVAIRKTEGYSKSHVSAGE